MSFKISRRDPALGDVSDTALRQLTKVLYVDPRKHYGDHLKEWLAAQERRVKDLDPTLLRPKDLLARFAISMSKTLPAVCPERAKLCSPHKPLDPRVIRNLLLLVADECTIQTNRYRSLRLREELTPSLAGWLDRMDFLTALWLGEEKFMGVFRRSPVIHIPECVESKCEACMLAVIGGSAVYLTDLRASLLARHAYIKKITGKQGREPRLLRIIESWVSFYKPECQDAVRRCSEVMVEDIVDMRTVMRQKWDREIERSRRRSKVPRMQRHLLVRLTEEGLPMPRQPRFRSSETEKHRTHQGRRGTGERGMRHISGANVEEEKDSGLGIYLVHGGSGAEGKGKGLANGPREKEEVEEREEEDEEDEEIGEDEYWIKDYRKLVLRGGYEGETPDETPDAGHHIDENKSKRLGVSSTLSFGSNTRLCTKVQASSWTSKIDATDDDSDVESPREIEVPLLYRDDSRSIENANEPPKPPPRPVSSVYSTDPGHPLPKPRYSAPARAMIPVEQTISMLSEVGRESVMPLPLKLKRRALTASEADVASCYAAMGWGGPKSEVGRGYKGKGKEKIEE